MVDQLLQRLAGPDATFREHQLEAIADLVEDRARVLCVQRTGWGKSAVYFVATALLREAGAGPTLIVSPLLALMRNQIEAARRLGLRAHTVNSTNRDAWDEVAALLPFPVIVEADMGGTFALQILLTGHGAQAPAGRAGIDPHEAGATWWFESAGGEDGSVSELTAGAAPATIAQWISDEAARVAA